jgi:hypothetical protein
MKQEGHDKKAVYFHCECCDYNTSYKSKYDRHIITDKHVVRTNETKKGTQTVNSYVCEKCNLNFNSRTTMWRHKKTCDAGNKGEVMKLTALITQLMTQNSELVKTIKEMAPSVGSHNNNTINSNNRTSNNFNIQLFLNEKCKDAINLSEFVESLKITIEDLDFSKKNGLVRGITDVMIKGLKKLDVTKRPIHCTDTKRDTMYIKDDAKWEKDETHEKMRNTIIKVANKERESLELWVEKNPNWMQAEATQLEYLTMVRNVCEPIENEDKNGKKIIHNISLNVFVDKGL